MVTTSWRRTTTMKYGFVFPGGEPRALAEMSHEAEEAGWDGIFVPDCICITVANGPVYDPWVTLAAIAMRTEKAALGTMLTPPSRRRPWKLARETMSLDHLSGGRMVLGLGALDDGGFGKVGEATDRKTRAELLDESLDIVAGLWSGQPFSYEGKHYKVEEMTFLPATVQQPRIPVWVVGAWPRMKSMQRVLRWDGLLPAKIGEDGKYAELQPDDVKEMRDYIGANRASSTPFDIVVEGETPGKDRKKAEEKIKPWRDAGATWWLETMWSVWGNHEEVRQKVSARIRQGPPRE
jgi:hypothetical protein